MLKNSPQDFAPSDGLLHGIYRGVVENNKDPEKMGRCQVRVFGVHSPNKTQTAADGIPTDHLPWAEPATGLFEGAVSGFGSWSIPVQGSHVFLFFERGHLGNPRYFACAPGKPSSKTHGFTKEQGFSDPDGQFPTEHRLNEPDWHRLSRDEKEGTIVEYKEDNLDKGVEKALDQGMWDEPDPFYNKTQEKYPNNNVFATHNGIIIEIDTSEEPRLHIFHPSNSYIEVDNEGNKVIRNSGNRYEIVLKNWNKHIKEDDNTTIDTNKTTKIGNDEYKEVGNDVTVEINGDENITIKGSKNVDVSGDCDVQVGGNCDIQVGGDCTISAGGNVTITGSMIIMN